MEKVRIHDIKELQGLAITQAFEEDFGKYTFVQIDNNNRAGEKPDNKIW
ncbi:MAG: hypothetical protein WKG06_43350 [Segetibacter sp.]